MTTSTLKKWGFLLYFFLTGWGLFWVLSFIKIAGANAQTIENNSDRQIVEESVIIPDINALSFQDFPPIKTEGNIQLPSEVIEQLGFNPNRTWPAGQTIDTIIQLGDISEGFGVENLTLNQISSLVTIDVTNLSLQDLGVIQFQTVGSLVQAIPTLENKTLSQVAPLRDLLVINQCAGELSQCQNFLNLSLKKLVKQNNFSALPLNQLDLTQYGLTEIPGLLETPLSQFNQWQQVFIAEIPGLSQVPFSQFRKLLSLNSTEMAQIDITFSQAEYQAERAISGSYQEGFNKSCTGGCSHIELGGNPRVLGQQWVSGNSQKVQGGHGVLGSMFGGVEPTGRHPFGPGFKVVLGDINEATGTVDMDLYFRICGTGWLDLGCSPYGIGPFPFMTFQERDWIFLGN